MTRNEPPKPRRPARREEPRADAPSPIPTPAADASKAMSRQRIAKVMARAGLCSRRDAEAWVLAGRVAVNGEVLASPARDVGPEDAILVDGQPLPTAEKTRLFLFHKPRGLVTSDHDPEERETVADFLRENWPEGPRVVTIGRLDINTEGLLLLTNDGGLARMLELPETGWLRRYRVRAKGQTDQAALDALAGGIEIEGIEYAGIDAKLDRLQGSNCWLTMGLREGKNREIKRVLEHLGLEVNRLIRLSFGPFQLLDLPEGAVEEVRTRVLRDQLGEKLASAAGVDFGGDEVPPPQRHVEAEQPRAEGDRAERGRGTPAGSRQAGKAPPLSLRQRPGAVGEGSGRTNRPQRDEPEPPLERRERSQEGPRRHVSALRATEAAAQRTSPRKRIERTATRDRHDRPVAVERLVTRDQAPRPAGRKRTSPSAEGKRVRVARSGSEAPKRFGGDEPRGRRARHDGPARDGGGAANERRRSPGAAPTGTGPRPARSRQDDGERFRRERPTGGRDQSRPSQEGRRGDGRRGDGKPGQGDRPDRSAAGRSERPQRRTGPPPDRADRERRSDRPAPPGEPLARGRLPEGRTGGAPGKRPFQKPPGRTSASEESPARRSSAGKPPLGRRPVGKRPFARSPSDKPRSGKPGGRPGGSRPPKG